MKKMTIVDVTDRHQLEVWALLVWESRKAAELWDENDVVSEAPRSVAIRPLRDQQALVAVSDELVVPDLVEVLVGDEISLPLLVKMHKEGSYWNWD